MVCSFFETSFIQMTSCSRSICQSQLILLRKRVGAKVGHRQGGGACGNEKALPLPVPLEKGKEGDAPPATKIFACRLTRYVVVAVVS